MSSLRIARDWSLRVLRGAGIVEYVAKSKWRQDRLLILCYHGFALRDEEQWNPSLYMSPRQFEARLDLVLSRGYQVLRLGQAVELLRARSLPRKSVVLTVDDGAYDFLAIAYPILSRLGLPATVYVSTYYVKDQRPVFDVMLSYLLWKGTTQRSSTVAIPGLGQWQLNSPMEASKATRDIRSIAAEQKLSADAKDDLLGRIAGQLDLDYGELKRSRILSLMNAAEIGSLDSSIASVQLHTHRHRVPGERAAFEEEVQRNKDTLVDSGVPVETLKHFCYPSGVFQPVELDWLRGLGIDTATTCEPRLAGPEDEPLLLPRFVDAASTTEVEFEGWLSGVRHLLRRRSAVR